MTGADEQAPSTDPGTDPAPDAVKEPVAAREYTHRRAPKYRVFLASGALLGIVAGLVIASLGTLPEDYSAQTVGGYFAAVFGLVGALLGGVVAVTVERRRR